MAGNFNPTDYLNRRYQEATSTEDPVAALNQSTDRLYLKKQKLAEATQRKVQALEEANKAHQLSQTIGGKFASLGTDNEYVRQGVEGLIRGTGLIAGGVGYLADSEGMMDAYKWMEDKANFIKGTQDTTFRAKMDASMPDGDITDPSSWTMGPDASIEGFMGNVVNVFGEMAPIVLGSLVTGGTAGAAGGAAAATAGSVAGGAAIGSLQAAGAGGDDASHYINSLSEEQLSAIPLFNKALQETGDVNQAREIVRKEAAQTQAIVGGLIGGVGGGVLGKLASPISSALNRSIAGRAGNLVGGAVFEGAQEVTESVAGRAAANAAVGTDRNTTEGTFADAVLGAAAGGGIAGVGEVGSLVTGNTAKELNEAKEEKRAEDRAKVSSAITTARESGDIKTVLDNPEVSTEQVIDSLQEELNTIRAGKDVKELEKIAAQAESETTENAETSTEGNETATEETTSEESTEASTESEKTEIDAEPDSIDKALAANPEEKTSEEVVNQEPEVSEETTEEPVGGTPESEIATDVNTETSLESEITEEAVTEAQEAPKNRTEEDVLNDIKQIRDEIERSEEYIAAAEVAVNPDLTDEAIDSYIAKAQEGVKTGTQKNKPELVDQMQATVDHFSRIKEVRKSGKFKTPEDVKKYTDRFKSKEKVLKKIDGIFESSKSSQDDVSINKQAVQEVRKIASKKTTVPEKKDAAKKGITLLMRKPDALSERELNVLAKTEHLGEEERTWVKSVIKARKPLETMDAVSQNILSSSQGGFRSLNSYVRDIRDGFQSKNTEKVNRDLGDLNVFNQTHSSKAQAFTAAAQKSKSLGKSVQVVPESKSGSLTTWKVHTGKPYGFKELRNKIGGYSIDASKPGSMKFVDQVKNESQILSDHLELLRNEAKVHIKIDSLESSTVPKQATVETAVEAQNDTVDILDQSNQVVTNPESVTESEPVVKPAIEAVAETATEVTEEEAVNTDDNVKVTEEEAEADAEAQNNPERIDGHLSPEERMGWIDPQAEKGKKGFDGSKLKSIIKGYFARKKGHISESPDYMNRFTADPTAMPEAQKLISEDAEIAEKQKSVLNTVAEFARTHAPTIRQMFTARPDSHRPYQISQEFIKEYSDANGTSYKALNSSVAKAVAVASLETLHSLGKALQIRDADDVIRDNKIPGLKVNYGHPKFNEVMYKLRTGGTFRNKVIRDAGKNVMNILGLNAHSKTPANIPENLSNEMGALVFEFLDRNDFLNETQLSFGDMMDVNFKTPLAQTKAEISQVRNDNSSKKQKALKGYHRIFKPDINKEEVKSLFENLSGSKGIIGDLFGIESNAVWPSEKPPTKVRESIKGSIQRLPKRLQKRLEKAMKQPHYIRNDTGDKERGLLHLLPRDLLKKTLGVKDTAGLIGLKLEEVESKNLGLETEIDNLFDFLDSWEADKPFYLARDVWSNHRVGLLSNVFNPLANKTHRLAMKMDGWEYKVPTTPDANNKSYVQFQMAVMEGLGVKTDKMTQQKSLTYWDGTLKEVQPAVDILKRFIKGETVNESEYGTLTKKAKDAHSLDSLWHLANYQIAQETKQPSFTATLFREADGVNNGPILAFMQTGLFNLDQYSDWGMKGGLFNKENGYTEFGEFAEDTSNTDFYQNMAKGVAAKLQDQNVPAFWSNLLGDLTSKEDGRVTDDGRKLFKEVLRPIVFGAATESGVDKVGWFLFNKWVDSLQALYDRTQNMSAKDQATEIRTFFNEFSQSTGFKIDVPPTRESLKEFKPNSRMYKAFFDNYKQHYGDMIGEHIDTLLTPFIEAQASVNNSLKSMDTVFTQALDLMREGKRKVLVDSDKMSTQDDLLSEHYREIHNEILGLAPVLHTALSRGGALNTANMPKKKGRISAKAGDPQEGQIHINPLKPGETKTSRYTGTLPGFDQVAKAGFVSNIHSLDSGIASEVYQDYNMLNVHDAIIANPEKTIEIAKKYNQATFNIMLDHSVAEETVLTNYRVYHNTLKLADKLRTNPEKYGVAEEAINKLVATAEKTFKDFIAQKYQYFQEMDRNRLEYLKKIDIVHQYAYAGSTYEVTAEDKAQVDKALAVPFPIKITNRLTKEGVTENDLATLNVAFAQAQVQKTPQEVDANSAAKSERKVKQLNKNTNIAQVSALQRLFDDNTNQDKPITYQTLVDGGLARLMKDSLPKNMYYIYRYVDRLMPEDFAFRSITKNQYSLDISDRDAGFYHNSPELGEFIAVVKGHNVNAEVLLHEMLHALSHAGLVSSNPQLAKAQAEIKSLYADAKQYVEKHNLISEFQEALKSVDEFLAWGMSNKAFQEKVLSKMEVNYSGVTPGIKQSGVANAIRRFTQAILQLAGIPLKSNQVVNAAQLLTVRGAELISLTQTNRQISGRDNAVTLKMTTNHADMTAPEALESLISEEGMSLSEARNLQDVMTSLVTSVYGPMGTIMDKLRQKQKANPAEAFQQATLDGDTPLTSHISASGLIMDKASLFVAEQVDMSIRAGLDTSTLQYKELERLFNEARTKLTPASFVEGDWGTASVSDKNQAKEIYNAIFRQASMDPDRRKGYLAQFAAVALTYSPLKDALNYTPDKITPSSNKLGDKIKSWYESFVRFLGRRISGINVADQANAQILKLAKGLINHEQLTNQRNAARKSFLDKIETKTNDAIHGSIDKVQAIAGKVKINSVQSINKAIEAYRKGNINDFINNFQKLRGKAFDNRGKFISDVFDELAGDTSYSEYANNLIVANKRIQQGKLAHIDGTRMLVKNMLNDASKIEERMLTRTLIRADLSSLLDSMSVDRVREIIGDREALIEEIHKHEQELKQYSKDPYFQNAAYLLGLYLVDDYSRSPLLALNAHTIATKAGLPGRNTQPQVAQNIEPIIDRLASLYALQNQYTKENGKLVKYLDRQGTNDTNVLEGLLRYHNKLKEDSRNSLFQHSPHLMQKGYIKELYDPYRSVVAVPQSKAAEMVKHGYKHVANLKDPDEIQGEKQVLMVNETGGLARYNSAAMSLSSKHGKGSIVAGSSNVTTTKITSMIETEARKLHSSDYIRVHLRRDNEEGARPVPVRYGDGSIKAFRYMMTADVKDSLLMRNTAISDVLGAVEGSIYDKPASENHNKGVVEAVYQDWTQNKRYSPEMYTKVSLNSSDPKIREIYKMIPEDTKEHIKNIWGGEYMMVKDGLMDNLFGYRDVKISRFLDKDPNFRNYAENIAAELMLRMLGENPLHKVDRFQDTWQTVVGKVKNTYVIRNLHTLVGNQLSNHSLLWLKGLSNTKIIRYERIAGEKLIEYLKDHKELDTLTKLQSAGLSTGIDDVENRIAELETRLENNPVKPLMEAGQFPAILEDLDAEDESYGFQPWLDDKIDEWSAKLPGPLKRAGEYALVAENTPIYKVLYKSTQMSDFVARYALYRHRKEQGVSEEVAQKEIRDTFINYDVPTNRALHFMNSMGFIMFTRYFMRVQRVINTVFKENAPRVILLALFSRFFGGFQSVLDSWFGNRIGNNPLESGAFEAIDAFDEPIVMSSALSLF